MAMRVTNSSQIRNWISNVHDAQFAVARLQQQISSGKRFTRASDDPASVIKAMDVTDRMARIEQYQRNIMFAQGFVDSSESAIGDTTSVLREMQVSMLPEKSM